MHVAFLQRIRMLLLKSKVVKYVKLKTKRVKVKTYEFRPV